LNENKTSYDQKFLAMRIKRSVLSMSFFHGTVGTVGVEGWPDRNLRKIGKGSYDAGVIVLSITDMQDGFL